MSVEKADRFCSEEDRVIVRVWTSGLNKKHPGENVGHVSIETTKPEGYMSLWPEGLPHDKKIKAIFENRESHYMSSYQDDFKAEEERKPELTYCFYTMNAYKISDEFKKIQKNNKGWTLLGNNIFIHQGNSHSCATMAYELLKAGGIYDMVSSGHSLTFSSTVAPDTLIPALKAAKQYELKHYPRTAAFLENERFLNDGTIEENSHENRESFSC